MVADYLDKAWAKFDEQERKQRLADLKADKEGRLKALGLRHGGSADTCIHCGQPVGISSGAEYGICQDCID